MTDKCIFCNLRDERIIYECNHTIAFIDTYPASPGHTLVVPKRHIPTYFDASEDEILAIGKAVQICKEFLDNEFNPDAYNIGINNGEAAGQSIKHLHVHIIPRYKGDVEDPKGGVRWILKNKANYWDEKNKKRITSINEN
ncbi:MAG: HIT family protein [Gammaproteobacteria bacterium]|jgi:diadenosine tetraphosphate (Ap4A) HIT family hydrolase|nr:HIT family protein [Gammaproteobacteria bacterium]NBQ34340.1 HIT family protein [Gammaproteobacteria bacterium]